MSHSFPDLGIKRLAKAFAYSLCGIRSCMKSEQAFRLEIYLSVIFVPLGLYLGDTPAEKALLAGSVLMVLIVELINSAIERVVDRISLDRHELSKEAKDMGSAAVFLSVAMIALTWGSVLFL